MREKGEKGLLWSIFENLFAAVPIFLGKKCQSLIQKITKDRVKWGIYSLSFLAAFGAIYLSKWILLTFKSTELYGAAKLGIGIPIFYGLYLVISFPFFLLMAYASKHTEEKILSKSRISQKRNLSLDEIRLGREGCLEKQVYLGTSFWTGKPFYLTEAMRLMHAHVVGSTGVGKTESVLLPLLRQDIESGRGAMVIDAKGDLDLLQRIQQIVETTKRQKDFLFFSLAYPDKSKTYNPLLRGNASEIKDKLIGATEWREEFYRKKAEEAALTLLRPMKEGGMRVTFRNLYDCLTDYDELKRLRYKAGESPMGTDLSHMMQQFSENRKFLSGLISDLALVTKSEFSNLVDVHDSEIDLLDVYNKNKIVYFALNTQGYEETAKRFGRLVLQDIKTVSNEIQTKKTGSERHFFPLYVDEFSSFVYENFMELLNKGRGAGFAITLLHQSLGDLAVKRSTFQQQILENTNIKIIMRQDDPYSIEKFAKIGGAKRTLVSTYQTEEKIFGTDFTGEGSIREAQTFRIDPDLVRSLGRGEAIVVTKSPDFKIDYIKLDHDKNMMMPKIQQGKEGIVEDRAFNTLEDVQRKFQKEKNK